ncbi:MAG: ATP-binding cassette domain-containing protein [Actinomycetota bacterium]
MTTLSTSVSHDAAVAVRADRICRRAGDLTTLHPVSMTIRSGEIVGIAGGSGAGKTTLLETIAGVRSPSSGAVHRSVAAAFVPQDDIIHRELPLRRTLLHAASLRLEGDADERARAVDQVLATLDLDDKADVVVDDLSGGQRKRASLGAEMLTDPKLFFMDEPTSGLDPANAAELLGSLRALAAAGSTIVLTTHAPADLIRCDRIVFVARGGHVAFVGTPTEAKAFFGVDELADVYGQLNDWAPATQVEKRAAPVGSSEHPPAGAEERPRPSAVRQWRGLVRRNVDLITGNRLTLGILAGSPVFIIGMMTLLFPSGAFDTGAPSAALAIQTLFWLSFNSFFFGLTYGLLQVVGEFEIVRRERRVGLRIGAYVASKLTVLVPLLAVVNAAQILSMELAGRLPDLTMAERAGMFFSLQLLSTAAVAIGLHASSTVQNPAQATLALPMLCFPQVLFAGAVVPVSEMGWLGEAMSLPLAVRWGFEPVGRILDLGPAAAREAGTAGFVEAFTGSAAVGWLVLAALATASFAATVRTLRRRTAADA